MATRSDAANELEALKAQLADFALRNAAETIARDPTRFLSSDLMKAVEASAIAAVEARLAREPRPSPEDFAEQVLMQIRPELAAAVSGAAVDGPRAVRRMEPASGGLMAELKRNWATVTVAALLVAAAGGVLGYFGGIAVERADARSRADEAAALSDSESVDGPVTLQTQGAAQTQAVDPAAPKPQTAQTPPAAGAVAPKK